MLRSPESVWGFFPARLERPGEDLLRMVAVIHGWSEKGSGKSDPG
jgi:hypothetical protein